MKLWALILDTFREIYAKKVFIGLVIIQVITLVITALVLFSDGMQLIYHDNGPRRSGDSASAGGPSVRMPATLEAGADSLLGDNPQPKFDSIYTDTAAQHRGTSHTFQKGPGQRLNIAVDSRAMVEEAVHGQMAIFARIISFATIFIGLFITASLIPSMMEKGSIDLLLSKPLPRTMILFGRAFGGMLAMAVNLALFMFALFALYGIASGVWNVGFLVGTTVVSFVAFVVVYSGVMLLNVYSESWILPVSVAYLHVVILAAPLAAREEILYTFISSPVIQWLIDLIYNILPQAADMITAAERYAYRGELGPVGPFLQGLVFTVVMFAWSAWKFRRKDF